MKELNDLFGKPTMKIEIKRPVDFSDPYFLDKETAEYRMEYVRNLTFDEKMLMLKTYRPMTICNLHGDQKALLNGACEKCRTI